MASRRPRIVIKPNIKPTGSKVAAQHGKSKQSQGSSIPEPSNASSKPSDTPVVQPEPSAGTVTGMKPAKNVEEPNLRRDSVDYHAGGKVSLKGNKESDASHTFEAFGSDSIKLSKDDSKLIVHETQKRDDTTPAAKPMSIDSEPQESPADKKGKDTKEDPKLNFSQISHSKVVTPKSGGGVSSLPELSDQPIIGETVTPDESEPSDSNRGGEEAAQTKLSEETPADQPAVQVTEEETQEIELPEKPKRSRGRDKKERTEPLPPCDRSPDRQKMKMSDLLSWNPSQNFLPKKKKKSVTPKADVSSELSEASVGFDDDRSNDSTSLPAPQVMIGSDGNIVLNTESLMVGAPKSDGPKEIIEEDDDDRYLNTNSYRQTVRTKLWTDREDEKFFLGLSMCGTDFSLMCNLMPKRSRKELKNKFRREERRNRALIDKALSNRQRYDMTIFERMAEEDAAKLKAAEKQAEEKKRIKQEIQDQKQKAAKKKNGQKKQIGKKRKMESEDEEDDWGSDYDENDEMILQSNSPELEKTPKPSKRAKKSTKTELPLPQKPDLFYPNKPGTSASDFRPLVIEEETSQLSVSLPSKPASSSLSNTLPAPAVPPATGLNPQSHTTPFPPSTSATNPTVSESSFARLQAIPDSTTIQIEMDGMSKPLQGVLLPSHVLPDVAHHLGIPQTNMPAQVLLVQEESSAGNLVHVYMVPETETTLPSAPSGQGNPASHVSNAGASTSTASAQRSQPPPPLPQSTLNTDMQPVYASDHVTVNQVNPHTRGQPLSMTHPVNVNTSMQVSQTHPLNPNLRGSQPYPSNPAMHILPHHPLHSSSQGQQPSIHVSPRHPVHPSTTVSNVHRVFPTPPTPMSQPSSLNPAASVSHTNPINSVASVSVNSTAQSHTHPMNPAAPVSFNSLTQSHTNPVSLLSPPTHPLNTVTPQPQMNPLNTTAPVSQTSSLDTSAPVSCSNPVNPATHESHTPASNTNPHNAVIPKTHPLNTVTPPLNANPLNASTLVSKTNSLDVSAPVSHVVIDSDTL